MQAIALVGTKKTGKTALGLALVQELLARGKTVAVAKHTRHHFDRPDTDTGRYAALGVQVVGISPGDSFVRWPRERFLPDLLPLLDADVLVVEGGKDLGWLPRVLLVDDPARAGDLSPELALACWTAEGLKALPGLPEVDTPADLASLVLDRGFLLPGLDCEACGRADCRGLAADIVAGKSRTLDCRSTGPDLTVTVAGHPLALNPFVAKLMAAGIAAQLSTLKGYAPGDIQISIQGAR